MLMRPLGPSKKAVYWIHARLQKREGLEQRVQYHEDVPRATRQETSNEHNWGLEIC